MMGPAIAEYGLTAPAGVATSNVPKVSRNRIQVEHIRIDSDKPYDEVRAVLLSFAQAGRTIGLRIYRTAEGVLPAMLA
jgi:hypothetical protein